MSALLAPLALFAAAMFVHAAWWRVRPPRRHLASLAVLFLAVPAVAALAWVALDARLLASAEIPAALALYAGAAACYLILYTGIEQRSPTLVIVNALERSAGGSSREDLERLITDDLFVKPRLEAMALDGLIARSANGWVLSGRGLRAARAASMLASVFRIRENA